MRIIFIHSGKYFFKELGPHYGPLIKHSMKLLPMYVHLQQIQVTKHKKHTLKSEIYLRANTKEKNKYRSIQSLPTGCIIGVALIDASYWFAAKHLSSPWSHGPYCYHIRDAFRVPSAIACRGNMGLWKISNGIQRKIQSMACVMDKINEWRHTYNINEECNIYSALTIMQPFAECIIRRIKDIENRGQKVFKLSANDGVFEGCRFCIKRSEKTVIDYVKYGQQFAISPQHETIPKYMAQTDFKYHRSASLLRCQCGRNKRRKKRIFKEDINEKPQRKRKKVTMKPLHELLNYERRKPIKRIKKRKLNAYNYYGDDFKIEKRKTYNLRGDKAQKMKCFQALINMGFDEEKAKCASDRCKDIGRALNYLERLEKVRKSKTPQLGYSESLPLSAKRKRKLEIDDVDEERMDHHNNKKKKRRMSEGDIDEEYELIKALRQSNVTYNAERQRRENESDCYIDDGWNRNNEKNKNKKLSSSMVSKIPRRRC